MSLLAIIPVWVASLLLYLASPKQYLLSKPLPKWLSYLAALCLYVCVNVLFAQRYPIVSASLASFVVLMMGLVGVTILAGKSKRLFMITSVLLLTICSTVGGIIYVA
ncbi:hypothetical protein A7985_18145 [Pseudoalteromonas luteoviolacea]|uniref:DUF3325 domain-containing protein n=1 Tax=Pseudoalteromonas luteoviolacea TaxID=43657 RepID=A0A1C0TLX3_9GAMM|nr:hypothetical protein [Pseudoalteromonas luteoviolacea]OCQ19831.1 hypothetical protein A7985_18145 [Pseudoalteromonas luteoviolacea]